MNKADSVRQESDDDGGVLVDDWAAPSRGVMVSLLAGTEEMLGVVVASFVGIIVVGMGGMIFVMWEWLYGAFHLTIPQRVGVTVGWAVLTTLEILSARWLGRVSVLADHPRPVHVALMQGWRGPAGVAAGAWWLAHAVAVVATVNWIVGEYRFFNPTVAERWVEYLTKGGLLFGSVYASTALLLLAVGAVCRRAELLRGIWRWRVPLDLVVTVIVMVCSHGE